MGDLEQFFGEVAGWGRKIRVLGGLNWSCYEFVQTLDSFFGEHRWNVTATQMKCHGIVARTKSMKHVDSLLRLGVWSSVLQCVAVCCSVLQCVAVCCSVLQCVAVCCCVLLCVAKTRCHGIVAHIKSMEHIDSMHQSACCSVLQCVAVSCSVLQWVAVCCSVSQGVAVCCSVAFIGGMDQMCACKVCSYLGHL